VPSIAHIKDRLVRVFGPTVRLQRITMAGVNGCRVVVRREGEDYVLAQTFELDRWGSLEANAAMIAFQGCLGSTRRAGR
jgi:hypothetical protein